LLKFFLNPNTAGHLRGLAQEFEESTNSVRVELKRLETAGMINSKIVGNKKVFRVNERFPLFNEVRSIVLKQTGLDKIIDEVVINLGDLHKVYLTGDLAQGKNSNEISLILVGNPDRKYLTLLIVKAEKLIDKKIQYLIYSKDEFSQRAYESSKLLLLWNEE